MSFQLRLGSMKLDIARAAPWLRSTLSPPVFCTLDPTSLNLERMSFSRRPSCGASTVMNRPLHPLRSACCTIRLVIARSLFTYNWSHWHWPSWAASTISSKEHDARVGIIWITLCLCAPRVRITSPSGLPSLPSAVAVT